MSPCAVCTLHSPKMSTETKHGAIKMIWGMTYMKSTQMNEHNQSVVKQIMVKHIYNAGFERQNKGSISYHIN